jgi:anhydro-N-acetylmuramic acid kinase
VGFHGQTVLHRPEMKLTVQLGDGRALAKAIGIDVVYDMRAADVAAGGQGAPLVPVYHRALANSFPTAFVNIGGVANVTYIGADGALLAFDTGPGNAMINDWMMKHRAVGFDDGGSAALDFTALDFEDGSATLAGFTVEAIAASQSWFPQKPVQWVICGGGRHNGAIMHGLRDKLGGVVSAEDVMLKGDAMEAEAWAYLAVRSLKGLAITFPGTTGVAQPMNGGVILKP